MFVSIFFVFVTSFMLMLVAGRFFIRYMAHTHFRSLAREYTPDTHRSKDFTPTMGGLCMVATSMFMLQFLHIWTAQTSVLSLILIGFCAIGAWDDSNKILYKKGISERKKFIGQVCVALCAMILWFSYAHPSTAIIVPYVGSFDLGPIIFIIWAVWVILCTVNAVNFTDGLDGLATLIVTANCITFGIIAALLGQYDIAIVCAVLVGVLLGFLWYNAHPAQIFMGDAGSLPLGAGLATIALMTKTELLILLTGGILVLEGVSVALQILWFKITGRRIFRMAPLHHHFELLGYAETKITLRFFIITIVCCCAAVLLFLSCMLKGNLFS